MSNRSDLDMGGYRVARLSDGIHTDDAATLGQLVARTPGNIKSFTLLDPVVNDEVTMFKAPYDMRITFVAGVVDVASQVRVELRVAPDRSDASIAPANTLVISSQTIGNTLNADISALEGDWIWAKISSITIGTPAILGYSLVYSPEVDGLDLLQSVSSAAALSALAPASSGSSDIISLYEFSSSTVAQMFYLNRYTAAGGHTLSMPPITIEDVGKFLEIKHAGTGVLTITGDGTDTVEGDNTFAFYAGEGLALRVVSGSEWEAI